jgi:hypothetical protein
VLRVITYSAAPPLSLFALCSLHQEQSQQCLAIHTTATGHPTVDFLDTLCPTRVQWPAPPFPVSQAFHYPRSSRSNPVHSSRLRATCPRPPYDLPIRPPHSTPARHHAVTLRHRRTPSRSSIWTSLARTLPILLNGSISPCRRGGTFQGVVSPEACREEVSGEKDGEDQL